MVKTMTIIILIGLIILGALGYIETIYSLKWDKKVVWVCLIVFLLFSFAQIYLDKLKDDKQAEDFYEQEVIEAYPRGAQISANSLEFFVDSSGNKCVALKLKHVPIQKSLKLWEGGYDAPPITLAFDTANKKRIVFKNSAYSS